MIPMKRGEIDERVGPGSVKAAIRLHGGDSIFKGSSLKKPETHISEMPDSKTRELHEAKRDIGRYRDSRAEAVSLKSEAENELRDAKNTARVLSSLLRDSTRALDEKKLSGDEKELERAKQELRLLRLDVGSVSAEKSRARRRIVETRTRMASLLSSLEEIKKEIEEVKDEQLVVELAHIEALRECGDIEAERAKEAIQFSRAIEQTRRKIKEAADEVEQSKDLEPRLAVALSDLEVLKKEMSEVREMEKRVKRGESFREGERFSEEELVSAQRELASMKEEGFQLMRSMDVIRTELIQAKSETARFEEAQRSSDSTVQSLNSKLLRAREKLDAVRAAEERANSIFTNLSNTLANLETEIEAARRDKALAAREAAEIRGFESDIDSTEEELEKVMRELEEAKAREDSALGALEARIGRAVEARAAALESGSSSITISRFEYEYLAGRAVGADDLADKKVAAAEAWAEAIAANEREIAMKIELVRREMKGMMLEEEKEGFRMERTFSAKRSVERELQSYGASLRTHRRSVRGSANYANANSNSTPLRRLKFRGSASPGIRNSFPIKKKRQVLPNFSKLFKGKVDKNIAREVM